MILLGCQWFIRTNLRDFSIYSGDFSIYSGDFSIYSGDLGSNGTSIVDPPFSKALVLCCSSTNRRTVPDLLRQLHYLRGHRKSILYIYIYDVYIYIYINVDCQLVNVFSANSCRHNQDILQHL